MNIGHSSSIGTLPSSHGDNNQAVLRPGAGRPLLDSTQLLSGHPMSSLGLEIRHQYPHPKQYTNKAHYFGNTAPVYEELIANATTYHHRFHDPLAFENRHRDVITAAPHAFRKPRATAELRAATTDMYGNPLTRLPHIMRPRTKPNTPAVSQSTLTAPVVAVGTGQQSPMSTGEFNSRARTASDASGRLSRGNSTPALETGTETGNRMSRAMSTPALGAIIENQHGTMPMPIPLDAAFSEEIDIDELVAAQAQPMVRSQRLTKSTSLPKLKRPKWQRLSKSNLGFPEFTTELRKSGPYKLSTA
jgi:hypothetical protein